MRKITNTQKEKGELIVRDMSQKAQEEYYSSDGYGIFADTSDPEMCYFRVFEDAPKHMTIKEAEEHLEALADDDWMREGEEE